MILRIIAVILIIVGVSMIVAIGVHEKHPSRKWHK